MPVVRPACRPWANLHDMWHPRPQVRGPGEERAPEPLHLDNPGRGAGGRRVEGGHDDHGELPRRHPHLPQDNTSVGPSPRRSWVSHRHPGSGTPPGRIGHLIAMGDCYRARGERQGKEKEQASPLTSLQALVTNCPRRFGLDSQTEEDIGASDGYVCAQLIPSPISAMDLAHVALSG